MQRLLIVLTLAAALTLAACDDTLDDNVATLNAAATRAAGGDFTDEGGEPGEPEATPTPEPTEVPNQFDLTADPNALLVQAWGRVNSLPAGESFTIIATERQMQTFILDILNTQGFSDEVQGGQLELGSGQVRLSLALVDQNGTFGAGDFTFQPTLDDTRFRLNPRGADLGGLEMPDNFLTAVGDTVFYAFKGAPTEALSAVDLEQIGLDNAQLLVRGTTR
ncbi:MAG: hypothetical protein GYB64_19535 [Chloroflexi bacterium]|nr:hypothetical protein [Chloroflexota bacterium]